MMLIIPVLIYATLPENWQAVIRVVTYVLLAAAGALLVRSTMRDARAYDAMRNVLGPGWREGQSAAAFQLELIGHCKARGWRVFWSMIADQQRVVCAIQKRQKQVVLLCLGPAASVTDADLRRAEAWRQEHDADRAVIFAATMREALHRPQVTGGSVDVQAYEALGDRAVLF